MNKTRIFSALAFIAVLAGCGVKEGAAGKGQVSYRTAPLSRTDIVRTVEATGTVTPRNSSKGIPVGAQVNGKLIKLFVDYNSVVTNGQVVALIDPLVYEAEYKSSVARLNVARASVASAECTLEQRRAELKLAEKTYERKRALVEKGLAPQSDLDSAEENRDTSAANLKSAEANLVSSKANVEASEASVSQAEANLSYCTIRSPVDGIVIDRKVEEGETVVSSYNAVPVLTIAEDLNVIWIEASVPEADVGNLKLGQTVSFTADAYRRKFTGKVKQIRRAATTTNNVVTFPVIIEAENPDELLFPGMTATLAIETGRSDNVIAVAAAALRFRPKDADRDRAGEVPKGIKIWLKPIREGDPLEVVSVQEGLTDSSFTELIGEGLEKFEGREAVVGYSLVSDKATGSSNPFMPKPPAHGTKGTAPEPKK